MLWLSCMICCRKVRKARPKVSTSRSCRYHVEHKLVVWTVWNNFCKDPFLPRDNGGFCIVAAAFLSRGSSLGLHIASPQIRKHLGIDEPFPHISGKSKMKCRFSILLWSWRVRLQGFLRHLPRYLAKEHRYICLMVGFRGRFTRNQPGGKFWRCVYDWAG